MQGRMVWEKWVPVEICNMSSSSKSASACAHCGCHVFFKEAGRESAGRAFLPLRTTCCSRNLSVLPLSETWWTFYIMPRKYYSRWTAHSSCLWNVNCVVILTTQFNLSSRFFLLIFILAKLKSSQLHLLQLISPWIDQGHFFFYTNAVSINESYLERMKNPRLFSWAQRNLTEYLNKTQRVFVGVNKRNWLASLLLH